MCLVACKPTPERCEFGNSERGTCLRRELTWVGVGGEPNRGRKRQEHTEDVEGETE